MIRKRKSLLRISPLILASIISFPFVVHGQTPIDCGQVILASIGVVGEQDSYTFTASAGDMVTIRARRNSGNFKFYLEPQVEQLVAEQPPQEELAVLLNFPPLEKAKADIIR